MNCYRCDYGLHLPIDHTVNKPQNVMHVTPGVVHENNCSGSGSRGLEFAVAAGGEVLWIQSAGAR